MSAYYNEHDPYAAQWLRNLILEGVIPAGEVDERSIVDVRANDLRGFRQCHFFAGIGGWAYALRLAGWSDDAPIWTGSCPCQPFSAAGQGAGFDDERHLWPAFYELIRECAPPIVVGEQVASPAALEWLDIVSADLEAAGYAFGAIDLSAAGVGAPHIRQRLFWVADSVFAGRPKRGTSTRSGSTSRGGSSCGMADDICEGSQGRIIGGHGPDKFTIGTSSVEGGVGHSEREQSRGNPRASVATKIGVKLRAIGDDLGSSSAIGGVAVPNGSRRVPGRTASQADGYGDSIVADGRIGRTGPTHGFWRDADWLFCRDGKWRPAEPGTFPLVDGVPTNLGWDRADEANPYRQTPPSRIGMLRGYGNAIVPQLAATFVRAVMAAGA